MYCLLLVSRGDVVIAVNPWKPDELICKRIIAVVSRIPTVNIAPYTCMIDSGIHCIRSSMLHSHVNCVCQLIIGNYTCTLQPILLAISSIQWHYCTRRERGFHVKVETYTDYQSFHEVMYGWKEIPTHHLMTLVIMKLSLLL